MDEPWTIDGLVREVQRRIAALPRPQNGQVRAVPDDRTIRYYGTLGLIDRPTAMRGRTALYGRKHVAQVVAIKRMQTSGKSLAEIQALWHTLDDATLSRMSGVELPVRAASGERPATRAQAGRKEGQAARTEFWKADTARAVAGDIAEAGRAALAPAYATTELRIELAPNIALSLAMTDDIALSRADVAAIRAAAAPLVSELAKRRLALHAEQGDDG